MSRRAAPRCWGCALLSTGAGALGVAVLAQIADAQGARTRATVFEPFTAAGRPVSSPRQTITGSCWTGSLASRRADAWRCTSGNEIIDPCFSSAQARAIVLCSISGPWDRGLLQLRLTKKLPSRYANRGRPSTAGLPWAVQTTSGWRCELATGATTVIAGMRLNYFCRGTKRGLWGAPARGSQPWHIYAAPPDARSLSIRVTIRSAWF
ncbi:MAG: hypothetical protein KGL16_03485 [Acidobacteriota bacterium]|nr:hypothetical protein [Acidobacteriota bacterium]